MKEVILFSGGIDSTTCAALAVERSGADNVLAISFNYGQRHKRELDSAQKIAKRLGVEFRLLDLSPIFALSSCPLIGTSRKEVPHGTFMELRRAGEPSIDTFVPFRNGLFLAAAASFSMCKFPGEKIGLWIGVTAEGAVEGIHPDTSPTFIDFADAALRSGTGGLVSLVSPFASMTKSDIVKEGLRLGIPFELTWTCYEGGPRPCGKCSTCLSREKAFKANGMTDPALEEVE